MSTLVVKVEPKIIDLSFTADSLQVILADGREVSAPLKWFPQLGDANDKQRKTCRLIGEELVSIGKKLMKIFQ